MCRQDHRAWRVRIPKVWKVRISYLNLSFQNFLAVAPCEKDHVRWSVAASSSSICTIALLNIMYCVMLCFYKSARVSLFRTKIWISEVSYHMFDATDWCNIKIDFLDFKTCILSVLRSLMWCNICQNGGDMRQCVINLSRKTTID